MVHDTDAPVDVRRFVLALCSEVVFDKNYENRFRSAHRDMHRFFWRLSQDPETSRFVAGLLFDTNGSYPHCEELDELFQELQLSGLLARPNPTYRYNDITFSAYSYVEHLMRELSTDEQATYKKKVVDSFKRELGLHVPDEQ